MTLATIAPWRQLCVGLVAGHHGSAVGHTPYVPRPNRAAEYLIVYSFGWGNAFGHPNIDDGVTEYESREWDDDHRMDTGGAEFAAKYAGPRGNVGILWPGAARGPCYADVANTPEEINGAAYQAAIENKIPLVANAMLVPVVQVPARTLAQRAADMAGLAATHASLTGALATVVATATVASHPNVQALAAAVVNCVMHAAAKCTQEVTNFVEIVIADMLSDPLNVPTLPSQAKEAAAQAHGCAAHADTIELVHDAIHPYRLRDARRSRGPRAQRGQRADRCGNQDGGDRGRVRRVPGANRPAGWQFLTRAGGGSRYRGGRDGGHPR